MICFFSLGLQVNNTEGDLEAQRFDGDMDSKTEAGMAYVSATRESLATTPMEGGSIIDIQKGFQVFYCTILWCNVVVARKDSEEKTKYFLCTMSC